MKLCSEVNHGKKWSLTPEGHGDGEEDSHGVVEEEGDAWVETRVLQLPEVAQLVTQRTHDDGAGAVGLLAADLSTVRWSGCQMLGQDKGKGYGNEKKLWNYSTNKKKDLNYTNYILCSTYLGLDLVPQMTALILHNILQEGKGIDRKL